MEDMARMNPVGRSPYLTIGQDLAPAPMRVSTDHPIIWPSETFTSVSPEAQTQMDRDNPALFAAGRVFSEGYDLIESQ